MSSKSGSDSKIASKPDSNSSSGPEVNRLPNDPDSDAGEAGDAGDPPTSLSGLFSYADERSHRALNERLLAIDPKRRDTMIHQSSQPHSHSHHHLRHALSKPHLLTKIIKDFHNKASSDNQLHPKPQPALAIASNSHLSSFTHPLHFLNKETSDVSLTTTGSVDSTLADAATSPILEPGLHHEISNISTNEKFPPISSEFFNIPIDDENEYLAEELHELYTKVAECLEIRHKYQDLSLQNNQDNPNNKDDWKIYPDPPPPAWHYETKKFKDGSIYTYTYAGDDFDIEAYDGKIPGPDTSFYWEEDDQGIFQVYPKNNENDEGEKTPIVNVPTLRDYYIDMELILGYASEGAMKSFAYRRLQYLEARWNLYSLLNEHKEIAESKTNPHRDFYNVRKVDTHVHHSASMNQKHLLRFIKSKMKKNSEDIVIFRDGKLLTLRQVFESLNLSAYDLSIDTLDMHAHKDTFHRFDKFNLKYNPIGEARLREIFLKTDNYINGKFLSEITKEVLSDLEQSKYQMAEYRISIYGRNLEEWDKLASWIVDNKLFSHNVRWLIQVPRLYSIYQKNGQVNNFMDFIRNIFQPLYEVTRDPSSHPKLYIFLQRVVGFDSVDDESKTDRRFQKKYPTPPNWTSKHNPPYSYYIYTLYSNLVSLNQWRQRRGFNTFVLRPHAGEAGDPDHLVSTFITSLGINHGIMLRKIPFLQYLYYLDQIGIAMSPLSNNALFLTYDKNPFYSYFKKGLNVSLSTDDPLQFSYTREPLIEEFSVAAQIYKLSNVDMCELARNSVLQCGFENKLKRHWIGNQVGDYDSMVNPECNDIAKTNVPNIRMSYRYETLMLELGMIDRFTTNWGNSD